MERKDIQTRKKYTGKKEDTGKKERYTVRKRESQAREENGNQEGIHIDQEATVETGGTKRTGTRTLEAEARTMDAETVWHQEKKRGEWKK